MPTEDHRREAPPKMAPATPNGIDYFLYDNQTRSSFGRDWGLKAATGELAGNTPLRQEFIDYCNLTFDTRSGILRDFGYAIGGLPSGEGYLLCVTLESADHLGRPACAIVGLWFARYELLSDFLRTNDPAATARGALGQEPLPERLVPAGEGRPLASDPPRRPSWPMLRPRNRTVAQMFRRASSPADVVAFLRFWTQRDRERLPRILGITSLRDPERFAKAGFALVFSPAELPEILWQRALPRREPVAAACVQEPVAGKSRRFVHLLAAIAATLVLGVGAGWLLVRRAPAPRVTASTPPPAAPIPTATATPPSGEPASSADAAFLCRLEELIRDLESLDPAQLTRTQVYQTLREPPLVNEDQPDRSRLIAALEHELPALRSQLIDPPGGLVSCFEGSALEMPLAERAEAVREKLLRLQEPKDPCNELERAFQFEFKDPRSPIALWCKTLREIRELAIAPAR